jgi:hypothetical protein
MEAALIAGSCNQKHKVTFQLSKKPGCYSNGTIAAPNNLWERIGNPLGKFVS